jgi:hypothetical protein
VSSHPKKIIFIELSGDWCGKGSIDEANGEVEVASVPRLRRDSAGDSKQ